MKSLIIVADVVESALPSRLVKLEKRGLSQFIEGSELLLANLDTFQPHGFLENDLIYIVPPFILSFGIYFGHALCHLFPLQIVDLVLEVAEQGLSLLLTMWETSGGEELIEVRVFN